MPLDLHFFGGQLLALQLETATNETTSYYPNRRRHACEGALPVLPRRRDRRRTRREATAYSCTGDDDDDGRTASVCPRSFNFETQWTAEDNAAALISPSRTYDAQRFFHTR